jgi:signal transduction histidine kinase
MYDSIITACKEMDAFALPRAVGQLETDRFIFANNSFRRAAGLKRSEISRVALSAVTKFHFDGVGTIRRGKLTPIVVRSFKKKLSIGGHAAFSREGLAYLMIPFTPNTSGDFEMGKAVALETERQRISAYLHDRLVPELLAVTFSVEAVCDQLEQEKHSAEPKLKEVCRIVAELLRPLHEELLNSPAQTLAASRPAPSQADSPAQHEQDPK